MPNSELANILRSIIQEELQPINKRLTALEESNQGIRQELQTTNDRLDNLDQGQLDLKQGQINLEKGQRKMQKDVTLMNKYISAIWDDIKKLDNRLTTQEKAVR